VFQGAGRFKLYRPVVRHRHDKEFAVIQEPLDLNIALKKLHELALAEGDLGYEYWYRVRSLLERAGELETQVTELQAELERLRKLKKTAQP